MISKATAEAVVSADLTESITATISSTHSFLLSSAKKEERLHLLYRLLLYHLFPRALYLTITFPLTEAGKQTPSARFPRTTHKQEVTQVLAPNPTSTPTPTAFESRTFLLFLASSLLPTPHHVYIYILKRSSMHKSQNRTHPSIHPSISPSCLSSSHSPSR